MNKTQEELAVSFLFLVDGRDMKEWLPALVTAVGDDNKWSLWRALTEVMQVVPFYSPDPSSLHEHLEGCDEEVITCSDDVIYDKLRIIEMPGSWYETASDVMNEIIDELRNEGHVHLKWRGEAGSGIVAMGMWFAEGEYMSQ